MAEDDLRDFLDEAGEHIETIQHCLLALENQADDDLRNRLFRAAHSIKGAAGMVGLARTQKLTHAFEEVLDAIRAGKLTPNAELSDILFAAADNLTSMIAALANGEGEAVDTEDAVAALRSVLPEKEHAGAEIISSLPISEIVRTRMNEADGLNLFIAEQSERNIHELRVRLDRDAFDRGRSPIDLFRRLDEQCEVICRVPVSDMPSFAAAALERYDYEMAVIVATDQSLEELRDSLDYPGLEGVALREKPSRGATVRVDRSQYIELFLSESGEEIEGLVDALLRLEKDEGSEAINDAFRFAHRLKGGAGTMGFRAIASLCHAMEDLLAELRDGRVRADNATISVMLEACDLLKEMMVRIRNRDTAEVDIAGIEARLRAAIAGGPPEVGTAPAPAATAAAADWNLSPFEASGIEEARERNRPLFDLCVTFQSGAPMRGMRAFLILNNLEGLGEVLALRPDRLDLEKSDPDRLRVILASEAKREEIQRACEVDQVNGVQIEDYRAHVAAVPAAAAASKPEAPPPPAVSSPAASAPAAATSRPVSPAAPAKSAAQASGAEAAPAKTVAPAGDAAQTVRVDLAKLDSLMNLAGELVIVKARFQRLAVTLFRALDVKELLYTVEDMALRLEGSTSGAEAAAMIRSLSSRIREIHAYRTTAVDLDATAQQLSRISTSLQNGIMSARMLSVGNVFRRFPRLVRDLARQFNKDIDLEITGEETELDKRVIDELGDPLTHIIRNSLDHGLESPAERTAAGKTAKGHMKLTAYREGGSVCIQVTDDGRGISSAKVLARARERGLIPPDANPTREEICQYIFLPGFSTAEKVTDISGRGVGMDIVRSRIMALKGSVEVSSEEGQGTTITLRIPLTLSIVKALLVKEADAVLAVPVEQIREIVQVDPREVKTVSGMPMTVIRNRAIPILELGSALKAGGGHEERVGRRSLPALILETPSGAIALGVDSLLGEEEVVVKALPDEFRGVEGLSGATILGDGTVALIVDGILLAAMVETHRGEFHSPVTKEVR